MDITAVDPNKLGNRLLFCVENDLILKVYQMMEY